MYGFLILYLKIKPLLAGFGCCVFVCVSSCKLTEVWKIKNNNNNNGFDNFVDVRAKEKDKPELG